MMVHSLLLVFSAQATIDCQVTTLLHLLINQCLLINTFIASFNVGIAEVVLRGLRRKQKRMQI